MAERKSTRKVKDERLQWRCPRCERTLTVDYENHSWQVKDMVEKDFNDACNEHLAECRVSKAKGEVHG